MFETVDNSNTYTDKDQTFQQEVAQLGLSSQYINKHGDNQSSPLLPPVVMNFYLHGNGNSLSVMQLISGREELE
jgi:hypothetical protein